MIEEEEKKKTESSGLQKPKSPTVGLAGASVHKMVWKDHYCFPLPRMIGSPSASPASQAERNHTAQRGEACVILPSNLLRISTPFASLSLS